MIRIPYALALVLVCGAAAAIASEPPSAEAVYQRFVDVSGGAEAITRVDTFHVTGTYAIPAAGLEGTIDLHYAGPDKLLFVVDLPGFGTVRSGYDGRVAWRIDPQGGARVLEGAERDGVLNWLARALSVLPQPDAVEGLGQAERAQFDGQEAWKVRLRLVPTGHTYDEYFDPETGRLLGRIETQAALGGEIKGQVEGYERWHGLLVASAWTHQARGQTWTATYTAMDTSPISPSVFALPDEIRATLEAPADG